MIGELRLKVDGMQKELHGQKDKLEEGARFHEEFRNDLRVAVQVKGSMRHFNMTTVCTCLFVLVGPLIS